MRAALDLFAERGYENTTVTEIAERAGLTKTTFFRHFPDKREVLSAGQDTHARLLADGIAARRPRPRRWRRSAWPSTLSPPPSRKASASSVPVSSRSS